jgi:hypothetical protein
VGQAIVVLHSGTWHHRDSTWRDAGSYVPLFTAASGAYLVAILIMHLILPRRRHDINASEVMAG